MLSFELDSTKEAVTINVDESGAQELIRYLEFVRKAKDHIHLVDGNELTNEIFEPGGSHIKFATIRLIEM